MKSKFEQDVQLALRHSEQAIEARHLEQLSDFRQRALLTPLAGAALSETSLTKASLIKVRVARRWRHFLLPAAGMSLASILVLVLLTELPRIHSTSLEQPLNENLELYDNLDFYYWLAETEQDSWG